MSEIRVAVVQMNPLLNEVSENLVQMSNLLDKICIDIVLFSHCKQLEHCKTKDQCINCTPYSKSQTSWYKKIRDRI